MPALHSHPSRMPESPKAKAEILINRFFPPPSTVNLSDIETLPNYLPSYHTGKITVHEIRSTILGSIFKKAPGEDGIPKLILKLLIDSLLPHLYRIFNKCLDTGFFPMHFRSSITVVFHKPGKLDYTTAKAYHPIALLNTLGKALEFILAKRITYLAETYRLLPHNHFGSRRDRSTKHALYYIVKRIYSSWNKRKIPSVLLLDITGAFDNVPKDRLLHNLRTKQINARIVAWIGSFLTRRSTTLRTNEQITDKIGISIGIPQGSPLSPILFLFYNAPLLEDLEIVGSVSATGFVDDVVLLVEGKICKENSTVFHDLHEKICKLWARHHGSKFASEKYQLSHFTRKRIANLEFRLSLSKQVVHLWKTVIYLGILLDTKLSWNGQVIANKTKALKSIGGLAGVAGLVWGGKLPRMRQILQSIVIPQLTNACSV